MRTSRLALPRKTDALRSICCALVRMGVAAVSAADMVGVGGKRGAGGQRLDGAEDFPEGKTQPRP